MIIVLCKIVAIWITAMGLLFLWKPSMIKAIFAFWKRGRRIYLAALVRFLLGVLFLLAASQARFFWVIAVSGVLFIIGGMVIILIGPEKIRGILEWWDQRSLGLMRFLSIIIAAFGALLIFSI